MSWSWKKEYYALREASNEAKRRHENTLLKIMAIFDIKDSNPYYFAKNIDLAYEALSAKRDISAQKDALKRLRANFRKDAK